MTTRQVYDYLLIELNKVQAPSLLREDFIYFLNKAIVSYIDKRYALYEITQQLTDDLGVLSATHPISVLTINTNAIMKASYDAIMPADYFHLLDCTVEFTYLKRQGCYKLGDKIVTGVSKLKSGMMSGLIGNYYLRPSQLTPFYYLHNTDAIDTLVNGTRVAGDRKGFINPVKVQIRYGSDISVVIPSKLYVDYLRVPIYLTITQQELDATGDTTQIMEFPDYVCYEIIKELVALLMENASDQRLSTNYQINQSVAPPMIGGQQPTKR